MGTDIFLVHSKVYEQKESRTNEELNVNTSQEYEQDDCG